MVVCVCVGVGMGVCVCVCLTTLFRLVGVHQELIEPTKWAREHVTTINGIIQTWRRVKNRSYLLW